MESSTTKSSEPTIKAAAPYRKLSVKLVGFCIVLAVMILSASCFIGYWRYRDSTYKIYNSFAYSVANVGLSYVDGDRIAGYLKTGDQDAAYREMAQQLYTLYRGTNVNSIYLCVPDADKLTIANVYDARVEEAVNPQVYALGAVDPIGAENPQLIVDIYLTGNLSEDYFVRRTDYGYNTSAVVPVRSSTGAVTALLVVDVPMELISEALKEYVLSAVTITTLVVALFLGFFLIYLRKGVVHPLKLIAREATAFIQSETSVSGELMNVHTHDEIQLLAQSVYQMETDIRQYISNLTSVTAERERIGAELDVARNIQSSMLPCLFPAFPDRSEFDVYATMTPAKEVGGDFYDFFLVDDDHLAMVMADVSGKGVPAALFMMISKTLLKSAAQAGMSPRAVLEKVNNQLCENNDAEMFVTVWLGILEISTGHMVCANAGHEFPAIRRAGGSFELYKDRHGFVLAGMENAKYREYELELNAGDTLFVYTDGVAEATNAVNRLYGTDRMLAALTRHQNEDCKGLLAGVHRDVDAFVGDAPQFDDITMLAVSMRDVGDDAMQKMSIHPDLGSMEEATAFFEGILEQSGAPSKVVMQVNIAVDEIFSNIARYSEATSATLGCEVGDGRALLRFSDNGRPYDPTQKPDPDTSLPLEEREVGGMGIFMVKKFMDTVTYAYQDGFNVLTLEKTWAADGNNKG